MPQLALTLIEWQDSSHNFEKRGLSGAVGADQRNPVISS